MNNCNAIIRGARVPGRLTNAASVEDYRAAAKRRLTKIAFDYLEGGAEDLCALGRNRAAFAQYLFRPRVMRDVSACSCATTLFDRIPTTAPMIVGPTGLNGLFWPRGDEALARAACAKGVPFVLSTASTSLLEDVRRAAPDGELWLQLYVQRDRRIAEDLMRRAVESSYRVLMITVDTPVHGKRDHDTRNGFRLPLTMSRRLITDCIRHPHWTWQMLRHGRPQLRNIARSLGEDEDLTRQAAALSREMDLSLHWKDLAWVRHHWPGEVIIKGIQTIEDARLAADYGADGIVISNHGGRQLDSAFAPLELLPAIADATGRSLKIFVDGGVRRGADVLKAVSLGAHAVLMGRAPLYGLAARGISGVEHVLDIMLSEMQVTMQLLGYSSIAALDKSLLSRAP